MKSPLSDLKDCIENSRYLDVHNHMDAYLREDWDKTTALVQAEKILCFSAGTDPQSWLQNNQLHEKTPYIIPCCGIHPWKASLYGPSDVKAAEERYASSIMINEIGLDTVWAEKAATLSRQIPLLHAQLALAEKWKKPVTLHTKGAEKEVLEILYQYSLFGILIHWYDGPQALIDSYLDLGCFFTIPPAFISDDQFRKMISRIPADRLLPETDNPSTWPWLFKKPGNRNR